MFYDQNGDLTPGGEVFVTACEVISGDFWQDYTEEFVKELPNWAQIITLIIIGIIDVGIIAFVMWLWFSC